MGSIFFKQFIIHLVTVSRLIFAVDEQQLKVPVSLFHIQRSTENMFDSIHKSSIYAFYNSVGSHPHVSNLASAF